MYHGFSRALSKHNWRLVRDSLLQNFLRCVSQFPFDFNILNIIFLTEPPKTSAYFNDIYKLLVSYVGGDKSLIRMNHVTPYGYRVSKFQIVFSRSWLSPRRLFDCWNLSFQIPFVIYFNSNKQIVSPPFDEGPQTLNKYARVIPKYPHEFHLIFLFIFRVAILPLLNKSFRMNGYKELRGFDRLQERHLSMLGYSVIQICYREWNSIHMNLPGAREHFLRNFLKKHKVLVDWIEMRQMQ